MPEKHFLILAEQLRMSHKQLPSALRIGLLLALAAAWLFHNFVPLWLTICWLTFVILITSIRYATLKHISSEQFQPEDAPKYAQRYIFSALFLGSTWAALALLIPHVDMEARIVIFVILISIAGGALTTNAGHIPSFYAYMLPIMLLYSAEMFMLQESVWSLLGTLTLVYTVFLVLAGRKLNKSLSESIELRYRWQASAHDLEETRENLHQELETRRRTEKRLKSVMTELELAVEHLEQLAAIDELTGLSNRRSFDTAMAREWNRARRGQTSIALLMIDIDHFKSYNDYYHHQQGDEALKQVAKVIKHYARRPGDIAARYGGEEFALILVNPDVDFLIETAEDIRNEVRNLKLPHHGVAKDAELTVSIGTARIEGPENDDYSGLIQMADKALYEAKNSGRDQIIAA